MHARYYYIIYSRVYNGFIARRAFLKTQEQKSKLTQDLLRKELSHHNMKETKNNSFNILQDKLKANHTLSKTEKKYVRKCIATCKSVIQNSFDEKNDKENDRASSNI